MDKCTLILFLPPDWSFLVSTSVLQNPPADCHPHPEMCAWAISRAVPLHLFRPALQVLSAYLPDAAP